jgi:hypothetical protein
MAAILYVNLQICSKSGPFSAPKLDSTRAPVLSL